MKKLININLVSSGIKLPLTSSLCVSFTKFKLTILELLSNRNFKSMNSNKNKHNAEKKLISGEIIN